ncbi:hypothetical protein [Mycoplasmopsis columbinasalis]|uniref:Uncharacterized protein n=1 Tax=Mycoplasmopsis columbinasalis TaxID=114880 RepID=A0A449BB39_9BACT|nr:hypothetical protein [Mycoplasmopsis columbinasalis]VEU78416.1 Uncharacterised protein [Mycoplasmopsis columbinasalis]
MNLQVLIVCDQVDAQELTKIHKIWTDFLTNNPTLKQYTQFALVNLGEFVPTTVGLQIYQSWPKLPATTTTFTMTLLTPTNFRALTKTQRSRLLHRYLSADFEAKAYHTRVKFLHTARMSQGGLSEAVLDFCYRIRFDLLKGVSELASQPRKDKN